LAEVEAYQMPFWQAYQDCGSTSMIGVPLFTTYSSGVPAMGASCMAPSICGSCIWLVRATAVLCGMLLAMSDSSACGVPGTLALTFSLGLVSGMFAKSRGN
jgi:hypothetical protein